MVPPSFSLPPQQLAEIFPFHLVFNRHKEIVQIGEVLQRSCPGLSVGSQIEEHFRFNRPPLQLNLMPSENSLTPSSFWNVCIMECNSKDR
jgi:hypothetical protein